jgi:hypothetical protein
MKPLVGYDQWHPEMLTSAVKRFFAHGCGSGNFDVVPNHTAPKCLI